MTAPFLLFLVFLTLKLTQVIDWDWIWVLSPIWISAAFVAVVFIIMGLLVLITGKN
jgi:hypothetical protein